MSDKKLVVIPEIKGSQGDITIAITNASFQDDGRSKKFPHPDFGVWLIEYIHHDRKLVVKRKGFFKSAFKCPWCQTQLSPEQAQTKNEQMELKLKDLPPFAVSFTMPMVGCPVCKKNSALDPDGSVESNLADAIINAFDSANIRR